MTIKVLHLIDSGGLYGAEMVLLNLVEEQVKAGLSPLILSAGTPDIEEKPLEKAALERGLPIKKWRMKAGFNLPEAWKILKFAKQEGVQILHSHGYKFNLLMGMWPRIVRRLPLVATIHGYVVAEKYTKMWVYQEIDQRVIKRIDTVIFVSESMRSQRFFYKKNFKKSCVINNGLNIDKMSREIDQSQMPKEFENVTDFAQDAEPLIGAIGRLAKEKNFKELIKSFEGIKRRYPRARLLILGEGPQRKLLEEEAIKRGLKDSIMMPGFIFPVYPCLKLMDLFVISSLTEGLPTVLLEAMFFGVPVVATNVGGIGEVLLWGKLGTLVEGLSAQDLEQGILHSLKKDIDVTAAEVRIAKDRIATNYSVKNSERKYQSVYKGLLNGSQEV